MTRGKELRRRRRGHPLKRVGVCAATCSAVCSGAHCQLATKEATLALPIKSEHARRRSALLCRVLTSHSALLALAMVIWMKLTMASPAAARPSTVRPIGLCVPMSEHMTGSSARVTVVTAATARTSPSSVGWARGKRWAMQVSPAYDRHRCAGQRCNRSCSLVALA